MGAADNLRPFRSRRFSAMPEFRDKGNTHAVLWEKNDGGK